MTDVNQQRLSKQRLGMFTVVIALFAVAAFWVFSTTPNTNKTRADELRRRQSMTNIINPTGLTEDFLSGTGSRLKALEEAVSRLEKQNNQLNETVGRKNIEIAALQSDLQTTKDDAATMIADLALLAANIEKNAQNEVSSSTDSIEDPFSIVQSSSQDNYARDIDSSVSPFEQSPSSSIKTVSFELIDTEEALAFTINDQTNYVPANAYTTATVLVGVDMSTGIRLSADPKPILLRITSSARSVAYNDKITEIDLEGCLVNGSAHAELSSERVYVQLQKITCNANDQIFESPVKGYVAQLGKVGVRGRVVSREGDVLSKALFSGILGGFGRGIARNTNRIFGSSSQENASAFVHQERLTSKEIATGGLGEGLATAADTVSEYLIERAEQYQPVIEMPTGIEVNIVFLSGFQLGAK